MDGYQTVIVFVVVAVASFLVVLRQASKVRR